MSRLSKKGARVLYVEPPFGLTREVLKQLPYYFRIWKKDGVYVYRLPLIVWKGILLNKSLSKVMLRTLIRMLGMGKGRPLLSWFYDVQFSFLAGKMDESLSVYDCVDELSGFSYVTRRHIEYEKDLLRKVDILFVTSLPLFNKYP